MGKWQGAMAASSCTSCAAGRVSARSTVVACADCATGWFAAVDTCTNEPPVLCPGSDAATCAADATDGATVVLEAKAYTWSSEITFENKRITIVGMGKTTLDRQLGGRFFTINSGGHVTVKHLTITGGKYVRLLALCFRVRSTDTCSCLVVPLLALRWSMHRVCLAGTAAISVRARTHRV